MKSLFFISLIGKFVAKLSRIKGGHGSALPGLIIEKIDPHFLSRILKTLPRGVAVISGTNGKTTTTKMVVELLRNSGLRVFTNDSGSNFTRGVASSAIREMRRGKLNFDIAVLELDEAHAVHFVREISPDFSLLLNVLRDQLDRFGEIDTTAKMLGEIAKNTSRKVVLNADDPRVLALAKNVKNAQVSYFGFAKNLREFFPTDEELHDENSGTKTSRNSQPTCDLSFADLVGESSKNNSRNASSRAKFISRNNLENNEKDAFANDEIILQNIENSRATFQINGENFVANMAIAGAHNFLNAAAALAFAKAILGENLSEIFAESVDSSLRAQRSNPENSQRNGLPRQINLPRNDDDSSRKIDISFDAKKSVETISRIQPAFGRGETFIISPENFAKNDLSSSDLFRGSKRNSRKDSRNKSENDSVNFAKNSNNISRKIYLNLVKNPAGFRSVLNSANAKIPTLFAINDNYADGRDVSWLYDVDFAKFAKNPAIFCAGIRAFDMALRLEYDDVKVCKINQNIRENLTEFLTQNSHEFQIFATYTAMLEIRKILKKLSRKDNEK